ncbi:MAG: YjgN family protein [Gammaproteobacteria bacterium]
MNDKDTKGQDWLGEPRVEEGAEELQLAPIDPQPMPFEFRGNAREYFKIWVVNLALTIVTLGIYSAWAKVRKLRYFYGNTYLDGSSFEFLGRPIAILKGRIIAVMAFAAYWLAANFYPLANLALLPVFALCFPWVMVKALNFRARNSAFRNLTFSYQGSYLQIAAAYFGLPVLFAAGVFAIFFGTGIPLNLTGNSHVKLSAEVAGRVGMLVSFVVLGASLAFPYFYYLQKRAFLAPRKFGDTGFSFDTDPAAFYRLMFKLSLFSVLMVVVILIALWFSGAFSKGMPGETVARPVFMPIIVSLVVVLIQFLLYITFKTWTRNLMLSAVRVGEAQLTSRLEVRKVFWLYVTNILAMVCTLGLLTPWAKVRLMRYQTSRTRLLAPHGTENFTGHPGQSASAVGEGLADIFDLDIAV